MVFTLWPKEVREAVFNLKGGERQLLTRLISSSYLLCRSSSCTRSSPSPASAPPSRAGSRPSTPPCPSPSQTRCIENSYSCIRLLPTQRKRGKHEKYFCSSFIKVSAVESSRVGGLRFDIWQNLQHWMPGVGSNERKIKFVKTFLNFTASWRKY